MCLQGYSEQEREHNQIERNGRYVTRTTAQETGLRLTAAIL